MRSIQVSGKTFEELITPQQIAAAVEQAAMRIHQDYEGKEVMFLVVLNGAFIYAADLVRKVNLPCEIQFVRLKSYEGMQSTGCIQELVKTPETVAGRDVIVIEDIVDTGTSMHYFKQHLLDMGARSVRVTSIVFKQDALRYEDARPDYIGLSIPKRFIIGYGLDWDEAGRDLDAIYAAVE